MIKFKIKIANCIFEVVCHYKYTYNFCKAFLTEDEPDVHITIGQEEIYRERILSKYGSELPDVGLEIYALHRLIADSIIKYNTLAVHGAAIEVNNKGFIFSGNSGVGKTTHIFNWAANYPSMNIINGDKPFITLDTPPAVYSSPWAGKEGLYKNITAPLCAIVMLERSENNNIKEVSFSEIFPFLLQQVYQPIKEEDMRKTIRLLPQLRTGVKFYRFECNNFKDDCFQVAFNELCGRE